MIGLYYILWFEVFNKRFVNYLQKNKYISISNSYVNETYSNKIKLNNAIILQNQSYKQYISQLHVDNLTLQNQINNLNLTLLE